MLARNLFVVRRAWIVVALGLVLAPAALGDSQTQAVESTRPFVLPIPSGTTWVVCQGYNGQISHDQVAALDLSLAPSAVGPRGCRMSTKYTSAGSEVFSPAAGTAYRASGCCGDDFICVDLDSGGSVAIGHLDHRLPHGTRVRTSDRLGTVAWPGPANGHYAHIHIQAHPAPGCMEGSEAVPLDRSHGFKFACGPNLPYSGETNQYSGVRLTRCGSGGTSDAKGVGRSPSETRKADQHLSSALMTWLSTLAQRWIA